LPIIIIGDCAEEFYHADTSIIKNKLNFLNSIISLSISSSRGSLLLARMAGQFAKPRTHKTETRNNITLPSYFGDMFNSKTFDINARQIGAIRLIEAYDASYKIVKHIDAHLQDNNVLTKETLFFCHEAYNLFYEANLTRKVNNTYYNLSTHIPWLGMRTVASASHVRFLSGIANPIGIKIGPLIDIQWFIKLLNILNPYNEPGKIVLMTRLGCRNVSKMLPYIIEAVQKSQMTVTWVSDPMHGNTEVTNNGLKTRYLENILDEIQGTIEIHLQHDSYLNGIHLEATYEMVTECIGANVTAADLHKNYTSAVDPRLNCIQASIVLKQYLNTIHR
jgi:3-deoxy-7-phosphoheptulonate synthase